MGDEPRPLEDLQDDTLPETEGIDAHAATIVRRRAICLSATSCSSGVVGNLLLSAKSGGSAGGWCCVCLLMICRDDVLWVMRAVQQCMWCLPWCSQLPKVTQHAS
jgi:hypothetical protein